MLLIASRSLGQGRTSGFATLAGIQVGTTFWQRCSSASPPGSRSTAGARRPIPRVMEPLAVSPERKSL
jgi:hypothetical protein